MPVQGKVKNGVVVLQGGAALPEGTQVTVRPVRKSAAKVPAAAKRRRKLLRHAGKAADLPADAARNLDHYLYGHAKK